MLKITKVKRGSVAKAYGLEAGDCILAFDGHPVEDEFDLLYYSARSKFVVSVLNKRGGEKVDITIEKEEEEELGLEIEKCTSIRTCHNRCLFCFVDQMPKGMRESLYVKDDDYGMSFSCGNFVTLTNLSDEGLERIVRLKLSPLYISVHAMNGEVREKLLRNRFAGKIAKQIETLYRGGIEMHCQAVIVPEMNDGKELEYTARELFRYYPVVKDLAVVPTGLTKYREGLYRIPDVDKAYSERFLDTVDALNREFGVNFVLPADEYFVKAEREWKPAEFYGEFEQIENGIGMTRKFSDEAESAIDALKPFALKKKKTSVVITGVSAAKINRQIADKITEKVANLEIVVLPVVNRFFGETVTCTGLLTGRDILAALEEYRERNGEFDEVVLPANTMKEFEEVFLCGMSLKELKKKLKRGVVSVNRDGGYGFVRILSAENRR